MNMINKFEAVGIGVSVMAMAMALFLLRVDNVSLTSISDNLEGTEQVATIVVSDDGTDGPTLEGALDTASNGGGIVTKLVVDDVKLGIGESVVSGDTVTVNYIGTLRNGQQFDNSYRRGDPFTFTVGEGKVIAGWEEGLVGMKVGGQRMLVIPASLGYGDKDFGPIPGGSTLVFAIELVSIN